MRALITGGKGFVGTWLVEHLLAAGDHVSVIDMEIDVADADALHPVFEEARPDAVYHLAAMTHVGESWEAPERVLRTNVLGTAAVLAVARQVVPHASVLVVSSAEVYGIVSADQLPLTEAVAVAPVTPYAASKAAAEDIALQAWRGYGQRIQVVRPFNHVGPGQAPTFAVSAMAKRIVEAKRNGDGALTVGTLTTRRDFTDVRDVVRAYRLLMADGEPGRVLNVCSGRDVAIGDLARQLMAIAQVDLNLETDAALVRPVDVPALRGDAGALEAEVGWAPTIDLETTLADVIAYWDAQVA